MAKPVQPDEFQVPEEALKRRTYSISMIWYSGIFLLIVVGATIYAAITGAEIGGILALIALIVATSGVISWAYIWYRKNAHFSYEAGPVGVTFTSEEYYIPQEMMTRFIHCVLETWAPHLDRKAEDVYSGIQIYIEKDRPKDPRDRTEKVVGVTYHDSRRSHVWGPYALDTGGCGYELLLHGAEYKWPGSTEVDKIELMGEFDLFRILDMKFQGYFPDRIS